MNYKIIMVVTILNIVLAIIDAGRIKRGKSIKHGVNGFIYTLILAAAFWVKPNYWLISALVFDRLIFFNISLNLCRMLPVFYVSESPKSIVDKISRWVFGKYGYIMYFIYLVLFIVSIFKT